MSVEGSLLAIHVAETAAKKTWQTDFVKFDDISAQLLGFTDRSQAELKWKIHLKDADVATPVPSDPKHTDVPNVDETPHCFYVHEVTSCGYEIRVFLSAPDDETKKMWMRRLLQAAKDGPQPPRFSASLSPRSPGRTPASQAMFCFEARVTQVRLHSGGKHAEYMITCHVSLFSRMADRRLAKEWHVWHRFSEFDALNEALKLSLGADKMAEIPFFKTHRDAIRSLFGWWSLDQDFLDHRRLQLDTFITRVCAIESAVDFFHATSDEHLKKFFAFDDNCEDVDHSPRKHSHPKSPPKAISTDEPVYANPRTSDMSPRDSDNNGASYSSAIMSPMAALPVAASPVPSPSKTKAKAQTQEAPDSPKADPVEENEAASANEPKSSRKKGKGKGKGSATAVKEPVVAAASEVEVVRQPAHTGGKKGKKGN